jgi:alkylhydroperoxidase/carboxymuconolactone decarboxylase family protein YurZ
LPEKQLKTFNDFYDAVRCDKTLDTKTTVLLHMAVSMALGCYP